MAKTKSAQPDKAIKSGKDAQVKSLSSVKQGAVTKPSQTSKSKTKDIAKQAAVKAEKVGKEEKKSKKAKKDPTPEPSTSESDDEEDSDISASSASSESEAEVPAPKVAAKTNGIAKVASKAESEDNDSSSSDSSASSGDEMEDATAVKSKSAPAAVAKNTVAGAEEDSESEEDSENDEESDEETENKGPVDAKALNGKLEVVASKEVCTMIWTSILAGHLLIVTGLFGRGVWQRQHFVRLI